MKKLHLNVFLSTILCVSSAQATTFDDIGYTKLKTELGVNLPDGTGVKAAQIEANVSGSWIPNTADAQFSSKTLTVISTGSVAYSVHANEVAKFFYGNTVSTAPGITEVNLFETIDWLTTGFLRAGEATAPNISATRIANHSWTADAGASNVDVLRRIDFVVDQDEFIQVVGMIADPSINHLLSDSMNSIAVAVSKGQGVGTTLLSGVYTANRARPDITAPEATTSGATPRVASAAAVLIEHGHSKTSLSTDTSAVSTINRNGDVIYNAERSETIKAVLMAGADRNTVGNTSPSSAPVDITDYRSVGNQTTNGLDTRFGAGQVNIYNSYHILNAGEQNSAEDQAATAGAIANQGFDYDPAFGGQGSNATATYNFSTNGNPGQKLKADLVWNLNATPNPAVLYDMDLQLIDVTGGNMTVVSSTSTIDNTENIWFDLVSNNSYQLKVIKGAGQANFNWDYALAWQITALPIVIAGQQFVIDENSAVTTPINTVTATVPTGTITGYSIVSGNAGNAFAIDNSGVLTVAGAIDYETVNSYSLGIAATDGLNVSNAEIVVVNVNNLNDVAPIVASAQTFYIDENSINGTSVGTVVANDVDSAVTGFIIVSGNTNSVFTIASNGAITVSGAIDFETTSSYILSIVATDSVNTSNAVNVVVNVNDLAPVVTPAQILNINENSVNGANVGVVSATEVGLPLAGFTIVGGSTVFAIANNGLITVTGALDFETTPSYTLSITATDGIAVSSSENVVINVNNLDEMAPVVGAAQSFTVDENSAVSTTVGTVSATDAEGSVNGFNIVSGNTGNIFAIASNGSITVSGAIDFETTPSYSLSITATDGVNTSAAVNVDIAVNDINETPAGGGGGGGSLNPLLVYVMFIMSVLRRSQFQFVARKN